MLTPLNMTIAAGDGLILRGTLTYPKNAGPAKVPLAVLAHQYPATRDCWAPLVADLLAQGVATLAFDMRGHGKSIASPRGTLVIDAPKEPGMPAFGEAFGASIGKLGFAHIGDDVVRVAGWGTAQNFIDGTRLLLVGGSVGGTGVLLAASRLAAGLAGVLTVGPAGAPAHGADAMDRIRANCQSLKVPMLLCASEADPFDAANNVRTWAAGLDHVATKIVPGADHAMAIYFQVRKEVQAFLRRLFAPAKKPAGKKRR